MLLAEAGCVLMALFLYISDVLQCVSMILHSLLLSSLTWVQGRQTNICALKRSSVDLPCSAERPTSSMKWYIVYWDGSKLVPKEISADENHVKYNMSEERNFTLTINNLTESDANVYCCKEATDTPEHCTQSEIQLRVADLQVKVIPSTEGQTVTLICSTSCPLTENPAAYIWYKNREFLYQDWSPWYQQLVSSEEAVTYSCAIKGYEHLRAPQVSVDSVTSTCFSVTYAEGTMCSYKQTSEDEPCSITYPTKVDIQRTPANKQSHVTLTCNTSCPLTPIVWYRSRHLLYEKHQYVVTSTSALSFSCAVKGLEDLRSDEVCAVDSHCWIVNYVSRRICALEGSSVNISSNYSAVNFRHPKSKSWYKVKRSGEGDVEEPFKAAGRVEYHDNIESRHILRINKLKKSDSAEYRFKLQADDGWKPGVTLVVTGLRVKFTPSAVVTEDQRVTLTCSTSCPLPDNTNYIWYFNRRPLTLTESQTKHLVLDPVSSQHAGNYSCAVNNTSSREKTLTVQSKTGKLTSALAAGVCAALLVIIPLAVFLWIRRKRTSSLSPRNETSDNLEQLNPGPLDGNVSAQTTEQDDLHYSSVNFSQGHADPLYSTVQPHPPQDKEHVPYAVVNFRRNMTPDHDGQAVDT